MAREPSDPTEPRSPDDVPTSMDTVRTLGWKYARFFGALAACSAAMWLLAFTNELMILFILWEFALLFIVSGGVAAAFGELFMTLQTNSNMRRRLEYEVAVSHMGGVTDTIKLTTKEKLSRATRESKVTLVMDVCIGIACALPFVLHMTPLSPGTDGWRLLGCFVLVWVGPLCVFQTLRMHMVKDVRGAMAEEHAKKAYREAVKDREQLAGGLVLDEHAARVGGGLTEQQDAGGLEVHEEVVLDHGAKEDAQEASGHAHTLLVEVS